MVKLYNRTILAGAALAMGIGGTQPGIAADLYTPAPTLVPMADMLRWTGVYVGGSVGGGASSNKVTIRDKDNRMDLDGLGAQGLVGGGFAGINYQIGNQFVLGVQGDFAALNAKSELSSSHRDRPHPPIAKADGAPAASAVNPAASAGAAPAASTAGGNLPAAPAASQASNVKAPTLNTGGSNDGRDWKRDNTSSASFSHLWSASLRAGWLPHDDSMLYVLGGYSNARTRVHHDGRKVHHNLDGFHVGAGMETRVTDNLTARVEYRYVDLSKDINLGGSKVNLNPRMHIGTVGLAWNLYPF